MPLGLLAGCFAPPPELRTQERIPPSVILSQVAPPPFSLLSVNPETMIPLTVPFRSEDAGESLIAALHLDFSLELGGANATVEDRDIPASTFEVPRDLSLDWQVPEDTQDGCHSLTLILTHTSNFSLENLRPLDDAEAAFVTWWLDVREPGSPEPHLLATCPT